jgi:hypothetical protein
MQKLITLKEITILFTTLIGLASILAVTGIIPIQLQANVQLLSPIIFVDIRGFKQEYMETYSKDAPQFLNQIFDRYVINNSYILIGMPRFQAKDERIVNDGCELSMNPALQDEMSIRYELGWHEKPPWWDYLRSDIGLRPLEERKKGIAYYVGRNARQELPFVEGSIMRGSKLQNDTFATIIDSVKDVEDKPKLCRAFMNNRIIYNIISLENNSNQKIHNIILKLNSSFLGGDPKLIAWTHSPELIEVDTSTSYLTTFRIPFLRSKTSIEFIIRSKHLYKKEDIVLESDRLKNLNVTTMIYIMIGVFFLTLLILLIDKKIIMRKSNK